MKPRPASTGGPPTMCKLLIVDGSAAVRRILMRAISEAEVPIAEILEAATGIEALACLDAHPDLDLILSEADVAELGGAELVARVRQRYGPADLPVVFVDAASPVRHGALGWQELGADGVLVSPFTKQSLHKALGPFVAHS